MDLGSKSEKGAYLPCGRYAGLMKPMNKIGFTSQATREYIPKSEEVVSKH